MEINAHKHVQFSVLHHCKRLLLPVAALSAHFPTERISMWQMCKYSHKPVFGYFREKYTNGSVRFVNDILTHGLKAHTFRTLYSCVYKWHVVCSRIQNKLQNLTMHFLSFLLESDAVKNKWGNDQDIFWKTEASIWDEKTSSMFYSSPPHWNSIPKAVLFYSNTT